MGLFHNDYVGGGGVGGWVGRSSTVIKNSYIYPAQQLVKYGLGWEEWSHLAKLTAIFFAKGI